MVFSVTIDVESEEVCFSLGKELTCDCSAELLGSDINAKCGGV